MKTAALIVVAGIVMLLMPAILNSIDDFRTDEQIDTYIETTAVNATSATVTLSQDLFSDNTHFAVVTSNITTDAPIASTYVAATNVLTVTGLDDDATRLLTVTYDIDGLEDYWGAGSAARIWPLLLIIGTISIVAGAIYGVYSRRGAE